MGGRQAFSFAISTVFSRTRSRVICSAHVVGGLGFPWQASRPWNPHSPPLLRHAKKTTGRWMRTIPPNSETSSSTCSTTLHSRNWPRSSCCEAESRSTLWSTEVNTDRLKLWRAWWTSRCWSTKALSRFLTPSSILLKRRKKWRSISPNSSDQRWTGPGWRWGLKQVLWVWVSVFDSFHSSCGDTGLNWCCVFNVQTFQSSFGRSEWFDL